MLQVKVSKKKFKELYKKLYSLDEIFESRKFKKFIAEKCMKELETLMQINLHDSYIGDEEFSRYNKANKYEIGGDYILISNDSKLSQADMYWVSDKTKARYPDGISIAYLIEYGTGIMGMDAEDWRTNVPSPSKRYDDSWAYKRDNILHRKVFGSTPKLIYTKLLQIVENNFEKWTIEYLQKEGY